MFSRRSFKSARKLLRFNLQLFLSKILSFADYSISYFMIVRCYRLHNLNYGLNEAIFQKPIDQFERYFSITKEIKALRKNELSILDVGSGGKGISLFEALLAEKRCDFVLFDIVSDMFVNLKEQSVVGDGCKLPFRDRAFDVVVSADSIEHVPKSHRHLLYQELKRVCKGKLIITCPLQSKDGVFKGRTYDLVFQYFCERNYGFKHHWIEQHIRLGHPTLEEISTELPTAVVRGDKNCDVWLKYTLFAFIPVARFFTGLLYCLFWKKDKYKKPFWGAVITLSLEDGA